MGGLFPDSTTNVETNHEKCEKSSIELLNVEVLKLNKEKDTWRDERLALEDMVHLAVKEKLAIQESLGESKITLQRVELENIELRKASGPRRENIISISPIMTSS